MPGTWFCKLFLPRNYMDIGEILNTLLPSCCHPSPISPEACQTMKRYLQIHLMKETKTTAIYYHIIIQTDVFLEETCITHLSTLNDEFTDTSHEHALSLAVFLVATQQWTLQTETLIIKWRPMNKSWPWFKRVTHQLPTLSNHCISAQRYTP